MNTGSMPNATPSARHAPRPAGEGRAAATRARILGAAERLFAQRGFRGATTALIARAAGISEGAIYRHFASKEQLLMALLAERVAKPVGAMLEGMVDLDDETALRAVLRERLRTARSNAALARVLMHEAQFHAGLRERYVRDVILPLTRLGESFIARRIEQGAFRPVDPRIALRALTGMLFIFVLWSELLQADKYVRFDDEQIVDEVVGIFLYGVKQR